MTTMTLSPPAVEQPDALYEPTEIGQNGRRAPNELLPLLELPSVDGAILPTFPIEAGWRELADPHTGKQYRVPLTLHDILYPTEDDIGVVYMSQGLIHELWSTLLAVMLRTYLDASTWLIMHDVLVYWNRGTKPPTSPDLTVVRHGRRPAPQHNSYQVGRDGPVPTFVAEITSQTTREIDLKTKPVTYAAHGVWEYLIIDIQTPPNEEWRLLGYRLDASNPFYHELTPDAEGGLTFASINLRFVAVERSHIEVYNATTGERLLTLDEQKARADSAEERAKAVEQENQTLRTELERLRAQTDRQ